MGTMGSPLEAWQKNLVIKGYIDNISIIISFTIYTFTILVIFTLNVHNYIIYPVKKNFKNI
jgi:hypothetical protein